ncbi:hypothetical protein Glove_21g331 [Diversispora epigaea]|uniref:BTB domain-containing protein n=1 Tax=Diversispora epigaea TaxID=1348612 RepID=A0A397JLG6_9GLOM|nr:hypothetical protein Glove_21g331 [Diversispora epigaea]
MESTFFSDMAEDFKQLFETMEGYDIKIYAGDDSQEIHAHSLVLRARSPYFRGALSSEWVKKEKGYFLFKKPNVSAQVFKIILKWVYCGIVDLREYEGPEILKILIASDELGLQKLIDFIQKFLIDNRDDFLRQDPVGMLYIITRHLGFVSLKRFCLETICSDPDILFKSKKYLTLEEDVLILILKYDELLIDEIELWDCLIKWGIEQKPKLSNDVKKFSDKDFKTLEERLHNCIPLIRFHEISMKDYYLKIRPFRKIISEELEDDILRCYMVPDAKPAHNKFPPRKIAIDSLLINKNVTLLFASWIDKQQNTYYSDNEKKIPYKFELLFRCSRDGNSAYTFHQKCDNQGATIVIAKIQNSEQLVGGYAPLDWNSSNSYKNTYDSFLFSMNNKNNISGATIGRVYQNYHCAIFCHSGYGPTFGAGNDLYCPNSNNNWSRNPSSYNISIPSSFIVSDWESVDADIGQSKSPGSLGQGHANVKNWTVVYTIHAMRARKGFAIFFQNFQNSNLYIYWVC